MIPDEPTEAAVPCSLSAWPGRSPEWGKRYALEQVARLTGSSSPGRVRAPSSLPATRTSVSPSKLTRPWRRSLAEQAA